MRPDRNARRGSVAVATSDFEAVLFDMDGVVTDTASHRWACKELFDEYLARRAGSGTTFVDFTDSDYRAYVDGRSRKDGVAAFLGSRGIDLPEGSSEDSPGYRTRWALANRKDEIFRALLAEQAPSVFASTVALIGRARDLGMRTGLVTASQNAHGVLSAAGVEELFDVCVDGTNLPRLSLPGKPDPAPFLEAARRLGVDPARAVVIEDALAGVRAGRKGGFGLVIGVDRAGNPQALCAHGAHAVVEDVAAVSLDAGKPSVSRGCELCDRASTTPRAWLFDACDRPGPGEGTREALCTLGNGYTATRGCAVEAGADRLHYPGTYAAGVFNRLVSHIGGRTREDEAIVNLPNWLPVSFRARGGAWYAPGSPNLHDHWLLDLRLGVLEREVHLVDQKEQLTRLRERRLVSMADPQATTVLPVTDNLLTRVADLRFSCRRAGHPLVDRAHTSDLWIAASAIHIGAAPLAPTTSSRMRPDSLS